MGRFDKWLGRLGSRRPSVELPGQFSRAQWSSESLDVRMATTEQFLQLVALAARLDDVDLALLEEEEDVELRGSLRGFPVRLAVSFDGEVSLLHSRYPHRELGSISLRYDPRPDEDRDPHESEQRAFLGEQVYLDVTFDTEAAALFHALPADVQARVVRELPRLGIWWLNSDDERAEVVFHESLRDHEDAVHRVAEAIALVVELTAARGFVPPPPHLRAYADETVYDWADRTARAIAGAVRGAKLTERDEDDCIDVSWIDDGVSVQIVLNHEHDELHVVALARGVEAEFSLESDPASAETSVPLGRVFVTPSGITGTIEDARAAAAIMRGLPPKLLAEIVVEVAERIGTIDVNDEVLSASVFPISQISDGGTEAIRIAKLFARVARALPPT